MSSPVRELSPLSLSQFWGALQPETPLLAQSTREKWGTRISLESGRRECGQIKFWSAVFNYGAHYVCGDGSKQDAVAKVAGGDVIAGNRGFAEDRKRIGGSGAQACPAFEDFGIGKFGDQFDCGFVEVLNRCQV